MATLTFTEDAANGRSRDGRQHRITGAATVTGTYGSDKIPVTASTFGLSTLERVEVGNTGTGTFGYVARYDSAGPYVRLYLATGTTGALTEVGTATDIGTHGFRLTGWGR